MHPPIFHLSSLTSLTFVTTRPIMQASLALAVPKVHLSSYNSFAVVNIDSLLHRLPTQTSAINGEPHP